MDRSALTPGQKQRGFRRGAYVILRALGTLQGKRETKVDHTIFSNSTAAAAIERVLADRTGPGQASARGVIELARLLIEREGAPSPYTNPTCLSGSCICNLIFLRRHSGPHYSEVQSLFTVSICAMHPGDEDGLSANSLGVA